MKTLSLKQHFVELVVLDKKAIVYYVFAKEKLNVLGASYEI